MYLPITSVYAVLWLLGTLAHYVVSCAFFTRVDWSQASRVAASMILDALFYASYVGVQIVATAGRLGLWLCWWARRLFPPLQVEQFFDLRPLLLGQMDPRGCRVLCPDFYLNYSRSALTLFVKAQRSGAFIALFCLKIFLDPETFFCVKVHFFLIRVSCIFSSRQKRFFPGHVCRTLFPSGMAFPRFPW